MPKVTVVEVPADFGDSNKAATEQGKVNWQQRAAAVLSRTIKKGLPPPLLLLAVMTFLLGKVTLSNEVTSGSLALFIAVAIRVPRYKGGAAAGSLSGLLAAGCYYEAAVQAVVMAICWRRLQKRKERRRQQWLYVAKTMTAVSLAGALIKDSSWYSGVMALLNIGACLTLAVLFGYGVSLLLKLPGEDRNVQDERWGSVALLAALAVAGLGDYTVEGVSLRQTGSALVIMVAALNGGLAWGCGMGVITGLVAGLSGQQASIAVTCYSGAGLVAGMLRTYGRLGIGSGFLLGTCLALLYLGEDRAVPLAAASCLAAQLLLLFLPSHWRQLIEKTAGQEKHSAREAAGKLQGLSLIFSDLAEISRQGEAAVPQKREQEMAGLLEELNKEICQPCEQRNDCWEKNFYQTYRELTALLWELPLNASRLPAVLLRCCQGDRLLAWLECAAARAVERRVLNGPGSALTQQLEALRDIMNRLAREVTQGDKTGSSFAAELSHKAALLGCRLQQVQVLRNQGMPLVKCYKRPCTGQRECMNTLLPLTAAMLGEKMMLQAKCGQREELCCLTMQAVKRLTAETAIVSLAKDGQTQCGDSSSVMELKDGRLALLLSDGMGSGAQALSGSACALQQLRQLLEAGFSARAAAELVNSLLLLSFPQETFVSLDIAIIDGYAGQAEFIKAGSAPSYIKRVGEVRMTGAEALPAGIVPDCEMQVQQVPLAAGDYLVMVSDGIHDLRDNTVRRGSWLANYLRCSLPAAPEALAKKILQQARQLRGGRCEDDMTVLVAKIIEY